MEADDWENHQTLKGDNVMSLEYGFESPEKAAAEKAMTKLLAG
ncbi:MAG: hypothetical protein AB1512_19395 [Thermodesulfobacteriota bacterium]